MECLIKIASSLELERWRCKMDDKKKRDERLQAIREEFRAALGLIISVVRPGGGTSNDGNTARKFFRIHAETARITGLNPELVFRLHIILEAINSRRPLNSTAFRDYCSKTADLFVSHYPWYYMPVTVHKVLIHGADIVEKSTQPVGSLSEEAQEASNKLFKNLREHFSFKAQRETVNRDVIQRLFAHSDPLVYKYRRELPVKELDIIPEVEMLLISDPE
ncbi:uncharacterized protein LOC100903259 [Galendromus occidentalis]|uniref:Uncharacterized protein LOC100903259 n=1 Tax=Galendromus occidentalis TaxID=34638 RepID=A0AAJ6QQY4_9ACAR|nr:uncharacterized protein LOC100903259 [Galendromus occidentalis]